MMAPHLTQYRPTSPPESCPKIPPRPCKGRSHRRGYPPPWSPEPTKADMGGEDTQAGPAPRAQALVVAEPAGEAPQNGRPDPCGMPATSSFSLPRSAYPGRHLPLSWRESSDYARCLSSDPKRSPHKGEMTKTPNLVVKLVYTLARHGFPMADSGESRVSGARNGIDRSGREGSNRAK